MADFDAIVIGSGMSGGWAAKELCERGLKVLVLERGQDINPAKDYSDMTLLWERPDLDQIPEDEIRDKYTVQYGTASYAMTESSKFLWIDDRDQPYETPKDRPFNWVRGYHTGGKSLMWSRQTYRWCAQDFENNKRDGHGVDWPIRYDDLAPWYDHVEEFAGISGSLEGLSQLPDGKFLRPFELTAGEHFFKVRVEKAFPTRKVIPGRCAHLREAREVHTSLGRSQCQVRNHCHHGCSFGAYFSSVSSTLPAARRTGNLTLVNDAVVQSLDYDAAIGRVSGVNVIDASDKSGRRYTARMVFLCAGSLPSAMILLNSRTQQFPTGLANASDQVGRNLMDHVTGGSAMESCPGCSIAIITAAVPMGCTSPDTQILRKPLSPFSAALATKAASAARDGPPTGRGSARISSRRTARRGLGSRVSAPSASVYQTPKTASDCMKRGGTPGGCPWR